WGWVRQQGRDPGELPIMVESLAIWKDLAAEVGDQLGFRQCGVTYLAKTEKEIAGFENWLTHARAHGLDTRLLSAAETADHVKAAVRWKGALHTASDARAEPWQAVPTLARAAAAKGVHIREACAVRALDLAAGRVAGVVTEAGRVACDNVVLAGGAWSRLFLGPLGISFPLLSTLASVAATEPLPEVLSNCVADDDIGIRRRDDGGYTIAPGGSQHDFFIGPDAFRSLFTYLPVLRNELRTTTLHLRGPGRFPDGWRTPRRWSPDGPTPFEAMRILNPTPNMRLIGKVQDAFARAFPAIGRPKLRAAWGGMIDTLPDAVPIVDHTPLPGLTLAAGMCGHGFGIGPGFGRVIADLVTGRTVGHDLSRFRFSRFSDGSRLAPAVGL
ncbi:MAG: FAD-binding oxidoreductase, partial [Tabrizicola sp.]|nr:FAD-binding oxidoreductase [Tabrizicola sp.]